MGISQLIQLGDSRVYGPRLGSPTVEQPPDNFCYSPNILGEGGHAPPVVDSNLLGLNLGQFFCKLLRVVVTA